MSLIQVVSIASEESASSDPKHTSNVSVSEKDSSFNNSTEVSDNEDDDLIVTATQSALLITSFDKPFSLGTVPVPKLNDFDILVRNKAIGLNPIDWKAKKYKFGVYDFPWINGRESSGVVVKVGPKVTNFKINDDVIISSTSYRDNRTSTFQEYTAIDSRLAWKLPSFLNYENGATLGVGVVTAGVILNKSFDLPLLEVSASKDKKRNILIWGGATVVGVYLTQLARIIGLNVISISSTDHTDYLRDLGAETVIDRHNDNDKILRELSKYETIDFAVDCISKETSLKVFEILKVKSKKGVNKTNFAGIVGVPKQIPSEIELKEVVIKQFHEDIEFGSYLVNVTSKFLTSKVLTPIKYKHYDEGGLDLITKGLNDLEIVGARAEKYVVSII